MYRCIKSMWKDRFFQRFRACCFLVYIIQSVKYCISYWLCALWECAMMHLSDDQDMPSAKDRCTLARAAPKWLDKQDRAKVICKIYVSFSLLTFSWSDSVVLPSVPDDSPHFPRHNAQTVSTANAQVKSIKLSQGQIGITYEKLFGEYLMTNPTEIIVEDPYIRYRTTAFLSIL